MFSTTTTLATVLASVAVLAASGCTVGGEERSIGDFRAGGCRQLAPDVLTIARDAAKLGSSASPPQDVLDSLATAQSRIRAAQPTLEPDLTTATDALVVQVGVVRLRSDTHTYVPSVGEDLRKASDELVQVCAT